LTESSKRGFRPSQEELDVMARPKKYPDELMDRGVRLVFESGRPIAHVARDLGVSAEALRKRVRRAEVDAGKREGLSTDEREELKRLRSAVLERM
jgi:transposase